MSRMPHGVQKWLSSIRLYSAEPVAERRTGVVRGSFLGRRARSGARFDWVALAFVAGLAVIVLLGVSTMMNSGARSSASPRRSIGAIADASNEALRSASTTLLPVFSAEATPTASPTPSPSPSPTPTPTPKRTRSPKPSATAITATVPPASAVPTAELPRPQPSFVTAGLVIVEPANGTNSSQQVIVVRGLAPPGAVITRDIPFWFDEHVVADSTGAWSFVLQLNPGENVFNFRVADDVSTAMSLTVYYSQSQ